MSLSNNTSCGRSITSEEDEERGGKKSHRMV